MPKTTPHVITITLREMIDFYKNLYLNSKDPELTSLYYQAIDRLTEETETDEDINFVFRSLYPHLVSSE